MDKQCTKCNAEYNNNFPDPCLGRLPNVAAACCGHGKKFPYFMLWSDDPYAGTQSNRLIIRATKEVSIKAKRDITEWGDTLTIYVSLEEFAEYLKLLSNDEQESVSSIILKSGVKVDKVAIDEICIGKSIGF